MVDYSHNVVDKQVEGFNRFARFVLIGNNIDGRVNIGLVEFEHFDDVKKNLPGLLAKLEFAGEWHLALYQVGGPQNERLQS